MPAAFDDIWLFTRGSESVRISRHANDDGTFRVTVNGPGTQSTDHQCSSLPECMRLQQRLDADLMAQGFQLNRSPDRRNSRDRRGRPSGSGRRRT